MAKCKVPGCEGDVVARDLCAKHYKQWSRHGKIKDKKRYDHCKVENCNKPHYSLGFCSSHYHKFKRGQLTEEGVIRIDIKQKGE